MAKIKELPLQGAGCLRRTSIILDGRKYEIDTANVQKNYDASPLGDFASLIDAMVGRSDDPPFETLVMRDGEWLNFTKMNFATETEALEWHSVCVGLIAEGNLKEISSNTIKDSDLLWDKEL